MTVVVRRVCLALLVLCGAYPGLWGYVAPNSWYRGFPGFGLRWVSPYGPFNGHFVADVNAMYLGLAVLALVAFVRIGSASLTRLTGTAWLVFDVAHLAYHLRHLDVPGPTDAFLGVLALSLVTLLSALVLVVAVRAGREPILTRPRVADRVVLAVLFVAGIGIGCWAYFAPRAWYTTFPGFGRTWLPQLGPCDEHLVADVGAMFLAYAGLSLVALLRVRDRRVVLATGLCWLVFGALHLAYHLTMLDRYQPLDQVVNVILLVALLVIAVIVLFPNRRLEGSHVDRTQPRDPAPAEHVRARAGRVPGHAAPGDREQEGR